MTHKEIQKLIDRYLAGETTAQEEKLLARELLRDNLPADWKIVREMLGELALGDAEYDRIMEERRKDSLTSLRDASAINQRNLSVKIQRLKVLRWSIAACLAALVCLGVVWEVAIEMGEKQNPVRDELFVARGFNPGITSDDAVPSPLGETSVISSSVPNIEVSPDGEDSFLAPTNPGLKPRATKRKSLRDNKATILPMLREDEAVRAVMLEYELFVLEEEFKNYDREMRLVEI